MSRHRHPLAVRLRWWRHRHPVVCWIGSLVVLAVAINTYQCEREGAPPSAAPTAGARTDEAEGTAALVPRGWLAVAIPVAVAAPPVRVGDRVDLFGADAEEFGLGADVLARGARVVGVADDAITVATRREAVPRVARALATGVVTLALQGPG